MKQLRDHQPRITTGLTACRVQCMCGYDTGLIRNIKGTTPKKIAYRFYINHIKGDA